MSRSARNSSYRVSVSKSVALRINEHDHEDDHDEEELRQSDACEHRSSSRRWFGRRGSTARQLAAARDLGPLHGPQQAKPQPDVQRPLPLGVRTGGEQVDIPVVRHEVLL